MSLSYANFKKYILNDEEKNKDLYKITTELQFHSSDLKKIQRLVAKFKKVTLLNLSNNKLASIPMEIGTMNSLITLNLSQNELTSLPDSVCDLTNLQKLIVISTNLKSLPQNIGNLQKLKTLWCSNNNIKELPKSLFTIKSLENLKISHNKITEIDSIGNLNNLVSLHADNNEILYTPIEMCDLLKVQEIDISYNKTNLEDNHETNLVVIDLIALLPELTFFKNDFNTKGKFCVTCKNESHSYTKCGHIICRPCASKQLLKQNKSNTSDSNDYLTECPACQSSFSVIELTEKMHPYALKNTGSLCSNLPMMSRSKPCECGNKCC